MPSLYPAVGAGLLAEAGAPASQWRNPAGQRLIPFVSVHTASVCSALRRSIQVIVFALELLIPVFRAAALADPS